MDPAHIFAALFLICTVYVFLIDTVSELGSHFAMSVKWSLSWYAARYLAVICGIVVSLDVLS